MDSLEKKILDRIAKDQKKMGGNLAYWMDSRIVLKELGVVAQKIREIFDSEINFREKLFRVQTRDKRPKNRRMITTLKQFEKEVLGLLVEEKVESEK